MNKKLHRLYGLFRFSLLTALFLTAAVMAANAAGADPQEAMGLISVISDAENFFPENSDEPMSRGNFIQAAVELFAPYAGSEKVGFADVDTGSALYKSLEKAVSLGWISDGDTFRPDDAVTLNEAAKICCAAAGYDMKAKFLGGYPDGYILAATRAGMLTSVTEGADGMSGKSALIMLWNTLNADKMEAVSYGDENSYAASEDRTLLSVIYDIYPVEGIMNANAYTAFGIADDIGAENRAEIDGVLYTAYDEKIHDYLGYRVRGYYREDKEGGRNELVYVYPKQNRVLTPDIEDAEFNPSGREITYGDEKRLTAKLSAGYEYVYNGRADYTAGNKILPEDGTITLVDNNDDGSYDVVLVRECYYMEVDKVNKYYMTVTDKWDEKKLLDLGKGGCVYKLTDAEGKEISAADLEEQTVLAVYASKDKLLINAFVCEDSVNGVLEFVYKDDKTLSVGGVNYKVSSEFEKQFYDKLNLGREYEFVLGVYGEIVKASSMAGKWFYAYLADAGIKGSLNTQLKLKVYTQYGEHKTLTCADKIEINGERKEYEKVFAILSSGGTVSPQLIRLRTDSADKVAAIATASVETKLNPQSEYSEEKLRQYDFGTSKYYYYNNQFYPYFNLAGSTVFKIPTDLTDEDGYSIGASFTNGNYSVDTVIPYDVDPSGRAGAVVLYSDITVPAQTSSTPIILIESVSEALDSEGTIRTLISGWSGGSFVEYYLGDKAEILKNNISSQLESGDIIHAEVQGDIIVSLVVDFIGSTLKPNTGSNVGSFNGTPKVFQYQAGKLYTMQDGYMYLSNTALGDGSYDFSMSNLINVKEPSGYVVYDTRTKTVHPADSGYLRTYLGSGEQASYVVIWQSYLNGKYGFIYQSK